MWYKIIIINLYSVEVKNSFVCAAYHHGLLCACCHAAVCVFLHLSLILSVLHIFFDTSTPQFPTSFLHLWLTSLHFLPLFQCMLSLTKGTGHWPCQHTEGSSISEQAIDHYRCDTVLCKNAGIFLKLHVHGWMSQESGHRHVSGEWVTMQMANVLKVTGIGTNKVRILMCLQAMLLLCSF